MSKKLLECHENLDGGYVKNTMAKLEILGEIELGSSKKNQTTFDSVLNSHLQQSLVGSA